MRISPLCLSNTTLHSVVNHSLQSLLVRLHLSSSEEAPGVSPLTPTFALWHCTHRPCYLVQSRRISSRCRIHSSGDRSIAIAWLSRHSVQKKSASAHSQCSLAKTRSLCPSRAMSLFFHVQSSAHSQRNCCLHRRLR